MSVVLPIEDDSRYRIYTATAAQTTFSVQFPFQDNRDIAVFALNIATSEYVEISNTLYILTGAGSPTGGSLVFTTGRTVGDKILILGQTILDRLSSIVRNGRFSSVLIDDELDRNRLIQQELARDRDRAVKMEFGGGAGPTLSADLADGDTLMKSGDRFVAGPNIVAIAAEADADADRAEAARDVALGTVGDVVAQGFVPIFDSRDTAAAYNLFFFSKVILNRYSSSSIVAPATYAKVPQPGNVEPSHGLKFQSLDGAWWTFADGELLVTQAGAFGDGVADDTAALQRARDYIASFANPPRLEFPAGIYLYSVSPNWAITYAKIFANGVVRLRYTGTGDAVVIDSGPAANTWKMHMRGFIIEAPDTAQAGVSIRAVHHSHFEFFVRGCGATSAALYVAFAVCTTFHNFSATSNVEGWYLGAQPKEGIHLTNRSGSVDPSFVSFCRFLNPIIEHTKIGANFFRALGCKVIDGTIEGCREGGLIIDEESTFNVIDHVDFEVNNGYDIWLKGDNNEIILVNSMGQKFDDPVALNDGLLLSPTASKNHIVGGTYSGIFVNPSAFDNAFLGVKYNRHNNAFFNDQGTRTKKLGMYNLGQTIWHDAQRSRTVLTVSASPFVYVNETANAQIVVVNGGTVSAIDFISSGVGDATGQINGTYYLFPSAALLITYSSAPTITVHKG